VIGHQPPHQSSEDRWPSARIHPSKRVASLLQFVAHFGDHLIG
jgi:hypothetical protein